MQLDQNTEPEKSICTKLQALFLEAENKFEFFDRITKTILPGTGRFEVPWKLWLQERKDIQTHSTALRDITRDIKQLLAVLQV